MVALNIVKLKAIGECSGQLVLIVQKVFKLCVVLDDFVSSALHVVNERTLAVLKGVAVPIRQKVGTVFTGPKLALQDIPSTDSQSIQTFDSGSNLRARLVVNVDSDLLLVGPLKIGHFFLGVVIDHNFLDDAKLAEKVLLLEKRQARKRFWHSDHIQKVVLDNTEVKHPLNSLFLRGLQGAGL